MKRAKKFIVIGMVAIIVIVAIVLLCIFWHKDEEITDPNANQPLGVVISSEYVEEE